MDTEVEESNDSVRFTWNYTPSSKVQQARSIIHPALHYAPLALSKAPKLDYNPLTCSCEAVMNSFCTIDYHKKSIECCFCNTVNPLPPNYAKIISPDRLPYELTAEYSTFEYHINLNNAKQVQKQDIPLTSNNCLLFVVDLCLLEKQMEAVKQSIIEVISNIPADGSYFVGLITFNKNVHVYELSSKINTVFCLNGIKEYKQFEILHQLGINVKNEKTYEVFKKYIIQIKSKVEVQKIVRRVKDIRRDQTITISERSPRATGQALNVAVSLSEASIVSPRIVLIAGGPCTIGPGTVIGLALKEQMRSAKELSNGENIKYFASSKKYYDVLGKKVLNKKILIDSFLFTLEEPGLAEMSQLLMGSGGYIVMHEQFSDRIFKESFRKVFPPPNNEAPHVNTVTEGVVSVYASKEVGINGALGNCISLNKMKPFVADKMIGKGKTHSWYLGSIDPEKTITILYETKNAETKSKYFYIQLKTSYRSEEGNIRTRITTVCRQWSSIVSQIVEGFDQESAIVYLAKYCVHKSLMEEQKNIRQWLDTSLCKWASYFAQYVKNDVSSFALPDTMRSFPQYIYHLRRSNFVNRFGSSLDESFYRAYTLNRESLTNCTTMVQPILLKYNLENLEPEPVPLDEEEMQDDVILLLDSYFNVIEWYGNNIQEWFNQKYHELPEYDYIKNLLDAPKMDVDYIMGSRFPVANYYLTHEGHSKQRFLKSRVNPKKTGEQNSNTVTDDSDLKAFSEHLVRVVTTQNVN